MTLKIILSLALLFIISSAFKHDLKQEVNTNPMPLFLAQNNTGSEESEDTPSSFFSNLPINDDWDEDFIFDWDEDDYLIDDLIDLAIEVLGNKIEDYKEDQEGYELEEYEEDEEGEEQEE